MKDAGQTVEVPFTGGRGDATQEQTDVESFAVLEPEADGFRNYLPKKLRVKTEEMMLDRAALLGLSVPEMAVLVGGLRVLGANYGEQPDTVTSPSVPAQLTNDFFVNLLDMTNVWKAVDGSGDEEYVATDRKSGGETWRATRADLVFGSNAELRSVAEVYAAEGLRGEVRRDFVKAWTKVMNADRFDLPQKAKLKEPIGIAEPVPAK